MRLWARPRAVGMSIAPALGWAAPAAAIPGTTEETPEVSPHRSRQEERRNMNFPSSSSFAVKALLSVPLVTEGTPPAHSSNFPRQCSGKPRAAALAMLSWMSAHVQHLGIRLMNSMKEIPKRVSKIASDEIFICIFHTFSKYPVKAAFT